ncbi:hypothetical protein RYX36_033643 [Vicia faba]
MYMKPRNWARADDQDLYLMWVLMGDIRFNWVKFIMHRIKYYMTYLKSSLFFSSFIQFIIELNDFTSSEELLVKALKHVDSTAISLMRYYWDKNMNFADNQVREDWVMSHIESLAKEVEEGLKKM